MRAAGLSLVPLFLCLASGMGAQTKVLQFDVVVYEATPGGIAAAVSAARLGQTVALVEYQGHIGGMTTSGLGKSDIEHPGAIGGLFDEFVERVYQYYLKTYGPESENIKLCRKGYFFEPSVAERVLNQMVEGEPWITLWKRWQLVEAIRNANHLTAIRVRNRDSNEEVELTAPVFIDASYEGDLAAFAGVDYRVGREARSETNELDAGVLYMDYETHALLPGTTGEGDKRVPAYTYRLCLTDDPANSYLLKSPPPNYNRKEYLGYVDDWKAGRMGPPRTAQQSAAYIVPTSGTVVRAFTIAKIPNHKFDVNINARPLGFPFGGENYEYPDAGWDKRAVISARIRNMTLGLLYFLQNDPEVPEVQRQLARRYNLPLDEFTDNEHFPWQLYVREARRIVGEQTLSEHDLLVGPELGRTRVHGDSVAAGEFPIDMFPVRKREPGHNALEGYAGMMAELTHPYQIPYGVMVPKTLDGLLVPVAVSATHVAFSSVRLEPTWMALGQAAGTAAHIAIQNRVDLRSVDVGRLQRQLPEQGQVLTYFEDIDRHDPAYAALQYFGTKGFFRDYLARSKDLVTAGTAREWLNLTFPKQGSAIAASFQGQGNVTFAELKHALDNIGVSVPAGAAADGLLTRGDFCRILYDTLSKR